MLCPFEDHSVEIAFRLNAKTKHIFFQASSIQPQTHNDKSNFSRTFIDIVVERNLYQVHTEYKNDRYIPSAEERYSDRD